jgi:hypothetical protein
VIAFDLKRVSTGADAVCEIGDVVLPSAHRHGKSRFAI